MRRKIELYIGGTRADLDEQNLVLYNYAFTDVETPTAVRNSYSKQVTLPATPTNDKIFSHCYRLDYRTDGAGFRALQETPFTIYSDTGEIIETGYLRLDSVKRTGRVVTGYNVSLFGGLGSFFYALSYTADGEKRTLADLDYLGTDDPATELDFIINASNVAQAWTRMASNPAAVVNKWDVVNFAPCYDGIPEGEFDADKGYGSRTALHLPSQTGHSADTGGNTLVKFAEKVDMWAAKDLRSYLQRPVFSIRALLKACADVRNNGGYTFDYSDVPAALYDQVWKTLPLIPSLGSFRRAQASLSYTHSAAATTDQDVATYLFSGLGDYTGIDISALIYIRLEWNGDNLEASPALVNGTGSKATYVFVQALAYNGGTLLGGSSVLVLGPGGVQAPTLTQMRAETGYVPKWFTYDYNYKPVALQVSGWTYYIDEDLPLSLQVTGADRIIIDVQAVQLDGTFLPNVCGIDDFHDLASSVPAVWAGYDHDLQDMLTMLEDVGQDYADVLTYTTSASLRSGCLIGKAELLGSKHTPADYLIAWAKLNGLVFHYEADKRKVTLMERKDFFVDTGATAVDLTDRVDVLKEVTVSPMYAAARWYAFQLDVVQGAFAKQYAEAYGVPYGVQRVNTNYAFDASQKNLLDKSPFRGAVPVKAHGKYWNYIEDGDDDFIPSPFLDGGLKYTLWTPLGKADEYDVPSLSPDDTYIFYYDAVHNGYDADVRLQLCDDAGKGVDGEDVLCWFTGTRSMRYFRLTDDSTGMLAANNGRPCWLITGASSLNVPVFSRYKFSGDTITAQMDFGLPREIDIPDAVFDAGITRYEKRWAAYLRDLLDQDTKVLRCRVDFTGLQVGQGLLRRFYWYDGALWVLNKISNYSLTTWDTVECELVKVKDEADYNSGQTA